MPYTREHDETSNTTVFRARPHRSLPLRGFAAFILASWAMLMIPGMAFVGTAALWVLLPFLVGAIAAIWYFLDRSYVDGTLTETLTIDANVANLTRLNPRKPPQVWQANTYWVEVALNPTGGPVENYLTLKGSGRTVEFGAFLSSGERKSLYDDLATTFFDFRRSGINR